MSKTLVAIDFVKKPNLIKRVFARLMGWKYSYSDAQVQWMLKRKVTGLVYKSVFFPDPHQSVRYTISWPYGQKL